MNTFKYVLYLLILNVSLVHISLTYAKGFDFDIAAGPFKPTKESFAKHYECPEWFRNAKFGIYMHWGLNSVPGFDGHYARYMYHQQEPEAYRIDLANRVAAKGKWVKTFSGWKPGREKVYEYHVRTFGHPSKFGYKDFIPLLTAEKFDADELAKFYKKIGARDVGVMAVHHDNFDMYDSTYQSWNSVRMGPKIDVVGEWRKACEKHSLTFAVTNHLNDGHDHAFFQGEQDATGPLKGVPYDTLDPANEGLYGKRRSDRLRILQPQHSQNWYRRIKELVDKYDPDLVFLDGSLNHGEYGLNFAAHYYNQSIQRNGRLEGIITIKNGHAGTPVPGFTLDVESGVIDKKLDVPWQVDTTVNPGWFYLGERSVEIQDGEAGQSNSQVSTVGPDRLRLDANAIVGNLVDTVSKNGTMMLNVGLRPDGSLPEAFRHELEAVGQWLEVNGEAIYKTRPYRIYGHGPTHPDTTKGYNDANIPWTAEDIRYTQNGKNLYVTFLAWPSNGKQVTLPVISNQSKEIVHSVFMLATGEPLEWQVTSKGIQLTLPKEQPGKFAYVVKIKLKEQGR